MPAILAVLASLSLFLNNQDLGQFFNVNGKTATTTTLSMPPLSECPTGSSALTATAHVIYAIADADADSTITTPTAPVALSALERRRQAKEAAAAAALVSATEDGGSPTAPVVATSALERRRHA